MILQQIKFSLWIVQPWFIKIPSRMTVTISVFNRHFAIKAAIDAHPHFAPAFEPADFFPVAVPVGVVVVEADDRVESVVARIGIRAEVGHEVRHEDVTLFTRDDELHFKTVEAVAHRRDSGMGMGRLAEKRAV